MGLRFWRRYNLVLDFPRETIYLRKSRWFQKENGDLSGITFMREKGVTVIDKISEGSPASDAGLRMGDVLLKIAGKDAAHTRIIELWKALGYLISAVRLSISHRQDIFGKLAQLNKKEPATVKVWPNHHALTVFASNARSPNCAAPGLSC